MILRNGQGLQAWGKQKGKLRYVLCGGGVWATFELKMLLDDDAVSNAQVPRNGCLAAKYHFNHNFASHCYSMTMFLNRIKALINP